MKDSFVVSDNSQGPNTGRLTHTVTYHCHHIHIVFDLNLCSRNLCLCSRSQQVHWWHKHTSLSSPKSVRLSVQPFSTVRVARAAVWPENHGIPSAQPSLPTHLGGQRVVPKAAKRYTVLSPGCPESALGLPPIRRCLEYLTQKVFRRHPSQRPELPQLVHFDVEEQMFY